MALPLLFAMKVIRSARPVLAEWNQLPPEAKESLRGPADEVRRSVFALGKAIGGGLTSDDDTLTWDGAVRLALNPSPEFDLARSIVAAVRGAGQIEQSRLLEAVGAGKTPQLFQLALGIAQEDGFIERRSPGEWTVTRFGDHELAESPEANFVAAAVRNHILREGLASLDELALAVSCSDPRSAEFLDAVEQGLATGAIEWLAPGIFGLPREQLRTFRPPQLQPSGGGRDQDVKRQVRELKEKIQAFGAAVQVARGKGRPGTRQIEPSTGGQGDLVEKLQKLKRALDDGLITPEEYERKKQTWLSEM